MIQDSILFYDLETTALEISKACIIECYITNWSGTRSRHWYIYPSDQQPITNSHIHHITEDKLREKGAITIDIFLTEFREFVESFRESMPVDPLSDVDPTVYLLAHNNNRYDKLVLLEEYRRQNRGVEISNHWAYRDTLVHFRRIYPNLGYGQYKLIELYNRHRESIPDMPQIGDNGEWILHSAKTDTEILRQLYINKIAGLFTKQTQFRYFFMKTL